MGAQLMYSKESKWLRKIAWVIAKSVRNHIEDMHAESKALTDDNMKEFNTNVRTGVYQALLFLTQSNDNIMAQKALAFLQPMDYREEDCYDEVENDFKSFMQLKSL